jgi:hypothetical protein
MRCSDETSCQRNLDGGGGNGISGSIPEVSKMTDHPPETPVAARGLDVYLNADVRHPSLP